MAIKSWKKNYADLNLPLSWENNDYGNDELPTFQFDDGETVWNINIDMPTQEERDERWGLNSNVKRFFVKRDEDYASTNCWFLETNSFDEVKEFCIKKQIETIAKKFYCEVDDIVKCINTEPTESLLSSLEDITDQLGREKITEESAIQLIHNISNYYRGRK